MAAAAAAALPAIFQAGGPMATLCGGELRVPAKRYQKYELIGQGAQKKVYRAFDEEKGIEVAWNEVAVAELARFREKDQQRVFSEIRVLKQLKHKNIMTLFDYWFDPSRLTLVFITEIFPDGTLRQYRRRHKLADLPVIKRWAWQILQGLVYLHGHNPPIIHRDLKCDNIFVNGTSGVIKIGDLGLVTLCKDLSAPQSVLGTPEFMAPELYEEKYDEKVDVYAFGMCLLELATMEYPYSECKNAAQIFKKVMQGIPPASVEKLTSSELKEFVMLCLCHDPSKRPEARQLLKHPFFETIRASMGSCCCNGTGVTAHKLLLVSSSFIHRGEALEATVGSGDCFSPTLLSRTPSLSSNGAAPTGVAYSGCSITSATGGSFGNIALSAGGLAAAAAAAAQRPMSSSLGCIAVAAGAGGGMGAAAMAAAYAAEGSAVSSLSGSFDLIRHPSLALGSIAASLARQPSLPAGLPPLDCGLGGADRSPSFLASPQPLSPIGGRPGAGMGMGMGGSIAAAAAASMPYSYGASIPGSTASSLSPSPSSKAFGTAAGFPGVVAGSLAGCSPCTSSLPFGASPSQPGLAGMSNMGPGGTAGVACGGGSSFPSLITALRQLPLGCDAAGSLGSGSGGGNQTGPLAAAVPPAVATTIAATAAAPLGGGSGGGAAAAGGTAAAAQPGLAPSRPAALAAPNLPAGVSSSAAAIAAAAVSAAAAAVASGSQHGGPNGLLALGLPSILEDHELNEDVMFDHDGENGGRGERANNEDEEDDEDSGPYDGSDALGDGAQAAAPPVQTGCRSQPVSLQVRSSGQAAAADMALSFAMSFTSQRGVRKKVGFQYDLLHDTASAIAVEMVENLSLNTAEAEAIAAMIQHEVSRFNVRQEQGQEQQQGP